MSKLVRTFSKIFNSSSSSDDESAASTSGSCSDTVLKNMKAAIAAGESSDLKKSLEIVGKSVTSENFQDLMLYALKKAPVDNYAEILKVLIDAGAEIDAIKYGETLLVKAITDNQKDISDHFSKVKILLDAGAGVYTDGMSESALHSLFMMEGAFGLKALAAAKLLLEHDANPYFVDTEGLTVIYYVNKYHKGEEEVKELIDAYDIEHPNAKSVYIQMFQLINPGKSPDEKYINVPLIVSANAASIIEATSSGVDISKKSGHAKKTHITQETIDYISSVVEEEKEEIGEVGVTCTTSSGSFDDA